MPAISLIIPLYNAVRHLRGCLNSVKAQTFTDFEVLLINDGSTDGTVDMAEACCRGDNRFRLITQANGGVSAGWQKPGRRLSRFLTRMTCCIRRRWKFFTG